MKRFGLLLMIAGLLVVVWELPAQASRESAGLHEGDLWKQAALESIIDRDGRIDLETIRVSAHAATVTLTGIVLTPEQKGLAELLAMEVPGVAAVDNEIRVIPDLNREFAEEKATAERLMTSPLLRVRDLSVRASGGVVTLRGIVESKGERRLAGRLAAGLPPVDRVRNRIERLV